MLTKEHVENILRVNGLSAASPDNEIKCVLEYARCQNLNELIAMLRSDDSDPNKQAIPDFDSNILAVEGRLKPESIKKLLGIDIEIKYKDMDQARNRRQSISFMQVLFIAIASMVLALAAGAFFIWHYQIDITSVL